MKVRAYAKVNLALDVVRKREDGYHDLEMIMAPITLHDLIYINVIDEGIEIESNSKIVPTDQRNIMYKVAQLMQERYGLKKGVKIFVYKHIPTQAGLAIGKKKLGIAEANKEAVKKAIENVVTFSNQEESISWKEFLELDIIGDKKKRLKIYDLFHLGYGNAKTLFKRLNMVGISREMIEKELENEGYSD